MKEVKTPKKPLAIYYAIVLLVLLILNFVVVPWASERQIKEVPAAVAFLGAIIDRVVRPQADNHKSLHAVLLKRNRRTGC